MNITSILLLLQLVLSLLVNVQKNPNATVEQKNQALSFANQAVSLSLGYISQNTTGGVATPGANSGATEPAPVVPPSVTAPVPAPAVNPPIGTSGISVSPIGPINNRAKSVVDDLAAITIGASGVGGLSITSLKLTISGTLATSTFGVADIKFVDTSNQPVGSVAATTPCNGGNCVFTWTGFGNKGVVSAGSSLVLKLRIDSVSNTATASNDAPKSFYATIQAAGDFTYNDTLDGSGSTVSLQTTAVPLPIAAIVYALGT